MTILVQKFGGTSVAKPKFIQNIAKRVVQTRQSNGDKMVVVISAMGHTTDKLISLARRVSKNSCAREMDALLATGEQISSSLLAMAIQDMGYDAISLNGEQAGILTEENHRKARILNIDPQRMFNHLDEGKIVVVAGFQGITKKGDITTLGRGGSDTTAVAVAGALKANMCEIYTDVDGVFTADPNIIPNAKKLDEISYDEMLELANVGAKVLHPRSVEYAKKSNIVVHVRSSFNNENGTFVKSIESLGHKRDISGVAIDFNQAKLAVLAVPDSPQNIVKIFNSLASANISVDTIVQIPRDDATNDIAFTVSCEDGEKAFEITKKVAKLIKGQKVFYDNNIAKVSVVGAGMIDKPGIASDMFEAIANAGINIQLISTSDIKISCIVKQEQAKLAASVIHDRFLIK